MKKTAIHRFPAGTRPVGLIAFCALAIGFAPGPGPLRAGGDVPVEDPARNMARGGVLLSASRRFIVIGPDHRENQSISSWAETIDSKLQAVTGIELRGREPRGIRIALREEPEAESALGVEEYIESGLLVHRLTAVNLAQTDYETFQGLLCQILLRRHVLTLARQRGAATEGAFPADGGLPAWLWDGLSQNTLPGLQTRNVRLIAGEWHRGRLPPVGAILNPNASLDIIDPDRGWNTLRRRAAHGTFMMWLLSLPDRNTRMEALFDRLAAGETVSAEQVAALIPDCDSAGAMDAMWDEWILAQGRVIRMPGVATPENAQRLEWELLLYPGDYGIPMTGRLYEKVEWDDLIDRREEDWIPVFARAKAAGLRLTAIGRGTEYETVIEAYVRFLDALRKGRREPLLRERLENAQTSRQRMARKAQGPRLAPQTEQDATTRIADSFDAGHGLGFAWE